MEVNYMSKAYAIAKILKCSGCVSIIKKHVALPCMAHLESAMRLLRPQNASSSFMYINNKAAI